METLFLGESDIKLPKNIIGMSGTDMIRVDTDKILAGCEGSQGKAIELTKDTSGLINGIICPNKINNRCSCPNVDSEICIIKIN